ncbi:DNA polymerase I, thermostable [anaerobic digester metagenome]
MKNNLPKETLPLQPVLSMLEEKGVSFDQLNYQHNILMPLNTEQESLRLEISNSLKLNRNQSLDNDTEIIWNFYSAGYKPISLSMDYLKQVRSEATIYNLLYQYKKNRQFLKQYGLSLLNKLDDQNCLHGHWSTDTATGRLKCRSPALQAFPSCVSRYFTTPKGFVRIIGDYSHIDLRVLAQLSQDKTLISAFNQSVDIHRQTASAILKKDINLITDAERKIGKEVNFSIIYGISPESLRKNLSTVNSDITYKDAKCYRDNFFSTYNGIINWQNNVLKTDPVYGLKGLSWTSFPSLNCRLNYPIQGSAAAGLKLALILLYKNLKPGWYISHTVHDEIQIVVPEKDVEIGQLILTQSMIEGMSFLIKDLPVEVHTEIKYSN